MKIRSLFSPTAYEQKMLGWLACRLRPYLARTHLIWGNPERISIGRNVMLVDTLLNCRSGRITIEDDVFFGHGVMLLTGKHDMTIRGIGRHAAVPDAGHDIIIRRGAWIASGAIVIGPCEIGEHAVVGAGAVVTGKVPASTLYAGNPAGAIRKIDLADG